MFSVVSVCVSVHLSVCPSIHLSVCMFVQAITFELLHKETSFLVYRYIFTISRSSLSIKIISQGQGHVRKMYNFTYFNMLIICLLLQITNKVKVTHQGQGHIKVKVKISTSFKFYVKFYLFPHIKFFVCGCSSSIRSRSHIKVKVKSRLK